jgi:cellulose synthase/poly-beta-1,6-N-acetylglucosamine synthase-like glycosyltransferase
MSTTSLVVLAVAILSPLLCGVYAYAGYPFVLRALRAWRAPRRGNTWRDEELPTITITLPAYNEEARLAGAIDAVLAAGYPADRLHVVVVSDASTDRTDDIARSYADRGVELLRMPGRLGKTAAENASRQVVRGPIIVNTDASVRLAPGSLPELIRVFADPTIGVASGQDVSVGANEAARNAGEANYVGYEMNVRALETDIYGIVGASGCFFAIRRELHAEHLPESLSRDFASALVAREHGLRAVSVPAARCFVPRAGSLQAEYRRKIRTMARGLRTLWYKRHLLNPFRYGFFAFALWSHKVARWLVYPAAVVSLIAIVAGAVTVPGGMWVLAAVALGIVVGAMAMYRTERGETRSLERLVAFAWAANLAGVLAWWEFLRGAQMATWEPTRRPG